MENLCIVIHVGVGRRKASTIEELKTVLELALSKGAQVAELTSDPMTVVKECIRVLEESPHTNAGYGSNVNRICEIECDASIIDGHTQKGASVSAVPNASNAIDIAHRLATSPGGPACLTGQGALDWFEQHNGNMYKRDLITDSQRKLFARYSSSHSSAEPLGDMSLDTVGAVVLLDGKISAGVSSGGTFLKNPGRVGQAGVYGTGCWANKRVGVSSSGTGEHLIKTLFASRCTEALSCESEIPPVMRLKEFLEKDFLQSACVNSDAGVRQVAAGVVGIVSDDDCYDVVWGHTCANFILAYSVGGSRKAHIKICAQPDIDDIEKFKVYASGMTVRLKQLKKSKR